MVADVLVVSTPTWVGHMSSVVQRVLERLDGEPSETDGLGRPLVTGEVAVVCVVGNEDGAHEIAADLFPALDDIGSMIPAQGSTYWNDEAMGGRGYPDLDETPEAVASTTKTLAENTAHLARALKAEPLPGAVGAPGTGRDDVPGDPVPVSGPPREGRSGEPSVVGGLPCDQPLGPPARGDARVHADGHRTSRRPAPPSVGLTSAALEAHRADEGTGPCRSS